MPDSYNASFANSQVLGELTKGDGELKGSFAKTGDIRNFVEDKLVLAGIVEQHTPNSSDVPCVIPDSAEGNKEETIPCNCDPSKSLWLSPCSVLGLALSVGTRSSKGTGVF